MFSCPFSHCSSPARYSSATCVQLFVIHLKQTIISTVNQRTKAVVSGIVVLDFDREIFYLLVLASLSKQSECVNNYTKILIFSHITKINRLFFQFGKVELYVAARFGGTGVYTFLRINESFKGNLSELYFHPNRCHQF